MLTMLFCTAFGSTQQTECVDALSNTENSQYAFKLRYRINYIKSSKKIQDAPAAFGIAF